MDPNANLAEQLRLANQIVDGDFDTMDDTTAERLAELVIALDGWLSDAGFLPRAWERKG